jgi:hypothetical protein
LRFDVAVVGFRYLEHEAARAGLQYIVARAVGQEAQDLLQMLELLLGGLAGEVVSELPTGEVSSSGLQHQVAKGHSQYSYRRQEHERSRRAPDQG